MRRDEAYKVLSDLVFKGFLSVELSLDGIPFVFKTINDKEFELIKIFSGSPENPSYTIRFELYFLVFSILITGSTLVLPDRDKRIQELYNLVERMPGRVYKKVMEELSSLREYSFEALKFIEGFSYTSDARDMWKSLGGNFPHRDEFTGIPGTTQLGMSIHQESWVNINRMMDVQEEYNQKYNLAILVASASNPKGVQRISGQHENAIRVAEERRRRIAEAGYIDKHGWSPEGWASPVDTAEELVAELDRQMSGIKDKHDEFFEAYMKRMKDEADQRVKDAQDRIKKYTEEHGEVEMFSGSYRVLDPKDVSRMAASTTVETVSEENATAEDKDRFLNKIGARVLSGRG